MMREVIVAPVIDVPRLMAGQDDLGLVSVTYQDIALDPDYHHDPRRVLQLRFHDVVEDGNEKVSPSLLHVFQLAAFVEQGCGGYERLLVHCYKGLSRSVSVALVLAYLLRFQSSQAPYSDLKHGLDSLLCEICRISPWVAPNVRFLELSDQHFSCCGVLARLGDGRSVPSDIAEDETRFGVPFGLSFGLDGTVSVRAV